MKLDKLLDKVDYNGDVSIDTDIGNITYDSRNVNSESCFVAIKGASFDGHNYIENVLDKGAKLVIIDNEKFFSNGKPIIKVNNSRKALSDISSNFFSNASKDINIIGVTGTNGKTTVSYIVKKILDVLGSNCSYLGTLGFMVNDEISSTGFTTPESLELHSMLRLIKNSGINYSVIEVSSHSLDQHRVESVEFDSAVFTNLTQDHLDYHKSMQNYFKAKSKLFEGLEKDAYAIINIDDNYGLKLYNSTHSNKISYGFSNDADIYVKSINPSFNKTRCTISAFNQIFEFESNLIGDYNISNIMGAIGSVISMGYKVSDIIAAINEIDICIPGRMELVNQSHDKYIYIDYAHTPDAYEKIFSTIKRIDPDYEIISVFGCGGNRDNDKRSKMAHIAEVYCDKIFITLDNPRFEEPNKILQDIVKGFKSNKHQVVKDRKIAIEKAIDCMSKNSVLLVLGKGREDYQIINDNRMFFSDFETIRDYTYAN
tara:strand:- start:1398 stop:2849 length:1452 start_codon:yes stop_codon:yes gene_type:complete